jgi:adenosylcobinamide kinase / adenosylcobinamide-phosphate guanylyltransferase
MGKMIFVTGGGRSGKSAFAEDLLKDVNDVLYIATATPFDDEMKERIRIHRLRRNPSWTTIEAYRGLGESIREYAGAKGSILLDCVTVMISSLMFADSASDWENADIHKMYYLEKRVVSEINEFISSARDFSGKTVIVSNEIGMGIVPATPLSRGFRDIAGKVNQNIAAASDEVYLVVSGIPVKIKG